MSYELVDIKLMTEFSGEMMAAVVEPVGRKANWSANWRIGGGDDMPDRLLCCTTIRSYRYWPEVRGLLFSRTGRIDAWFNFVIILSKYT